MATLGTTYLNLADKLKQTDGKGQIVAEIIELMNQTNAILDDANIIECNDGTTHLTSIRTGLPTAIFRQMYGFVPPSKSGVAQVQDTTGMLEAYSVVDVDLVDKAKNPQQFRLNEARAFLEAMNDTWQTTLFYGNQKTNAAAFDGLAVRYGTISTDPTNIGYNIIDAGGTGATNTSIWFITWGDLHTSLIYPEGSQGGIKRSDDGIQTETDGNGGKRKVYQEQFKLDTGLTVRDWRSSARIANIDVPTAKAGSTALDNFMLQAYYQIRKYAKTGKTVIYANSDILYCLHKAAKDKANVHLDLQQALDGGAPILTFQGIPIKEAQQILNTEARVTTST